jgi:hypothetical protein
MEIQTVLDIALLQLWFLLRVWDDMYRLCEVWGFVDGEH